MSRANTWFIGECAAKAARIGLTGASLASFDELMDTSPDDFVTVDERGSTVAPAARAKRGGTWVSPPARSGSTREPELEGVMEPAHPVAPVDVPHDNAKVSLVIQMTREEANRLGLSARAAGLCRSAYLVGLLDGVPVLTSGGSRADHLAALVSSCAELSTFGRNLHQLTSLLREGNVQRALEYRDMLDSLVASVRAHLRLAARALFEIQGPADRDLADPDRDAMTRSQDIDGILVTWGDRLFYPANRIVKGAAAPKLSGEAMHQRAAEIRRRIEATVVRRAQQVMVRITGGGRTTRAIAVHFRYIGRGGRLEIEDDRGETFRGPQVARDLAQDWRFSGTLIPGDTEARSRREALNITLAMPMGTDLTALRRAVSEFARVEFADHKYVMVLHDHPTNPHVHVHVCVRIESRYGKRLDPRKADLHRWRETFAAKLRERGIEAEATRQATRGNSRNHDPLWRIKAGEAGRLRTSRANVKLGAGARATRSAARASWQQLARVLRASNDIGDHELARSIENYVGSFIVKDVQATVTRTAPEADRSRLGGATERSR